MEIQTMNTKVILHKILYWLPAGALMILIFLLSSRQSISISTEFSINFIFFKSLHIGFYATLTFLYAFALRMTTNFSKKDQLLIAVMLAIAYGISDEIHQTYVPTRTGTFRDIGIDLIGILAMWYALKTKLSDLLRY